MPSGSDAESDTGIRLLLWGELEAAAEHLTNALELFAALDAVWWECIDLILLASVRRQQGRTAEANAALPRAGALANALHETHLQALCLLERGRLARSDGDPERHATSSDQLLTGTTRCVSTPAASDADGTARPQ
jgi:ATP/maltotriose-dependent transcriptional regulator MalT